MYNGPTRIKTKKFPSEGLVIFTLQGEFEEPSVLSEAVMPILLEYPHLVFDVGDVIYMNSSTFGLFFEMKAQLEENKSEIVFMNMNQKFKIIYESLGSKNIFRVIDSLNDL